MVKGIALTLFFEFLANEFRAKLLRKFVKKQNGIKRIKLKYIRV